MSNRLDMKKNTNNPKDKTKYDGPEKPDADQHDIYMHDIYTEREVIQCFWGSEALLES